VKQIAAMSRQGIRSLDEIVWAVNPRNDTLADLLDYSGQYAVNFLQPANIRCRVDFPEPAPARKLSADARHDLFLAVKEALNNVVKHSGATEVWLRARVTDGKLEWTIEDNGCGFSSSESSETRNAELETRNAAQADGLRNMRRRLASLGGVCSIESNAAEPGRGTKIKFEVPLANDE
jgi:signal transduction histidine kinase